MVCFYLSLSAYLSTCHRFTHRCKDSCGWSSYSGMYVCKCIKIFYYKTRHVKHLIFYFIHSSTNFFGIPGIEAFWNLFISTSTIYFIGYYFLSTFMY